MNHRYLWLAPLAILFLVISYLTDDWFRGISGNLGAGFLGSLATVFLIDRVMEKARQRQDERMKRAAFDRLRPTIVAHLSFLSDLHKASATEAPHITPLTIADVFSDSYFDDVRWLDFSRPGPVTPQQSWFDVGDREARQLRSELERTLDTYVAFVDPESVEMMEALRNSGIVQLLIQAKLIPEMDRKAGFRNMYNLLYDNSVVEALRRHVRYLQRLVTDFNRCATKPISVADLPLWRRDVAPALGSARLRGQN